MTALERHFSALDSDDLFVDSAEVLGRMSADELAEIDRCELCLEKYEDCGCRLNQPRRAAHNTESRGEE